MMDSPYPIILASNFRVGLHGSAIIRKRNQQRDRRRFLRRAGLIVLTAIIPVTWVSVEIYHGLVQAEQDQKLEQLESQVQTVSHSYDEKAGNPMWARFLPREWAQYDIEVSEARRTLAVLSGHPDDVQLEGQLSQYLEKAESSGKKLEGDIRSFLEKKIHERCPWHSQEAREPGWRTCPFPPADHYRFHFWQEGHGVSWRLSDGWSGHYSLEQLQVPANPQPEGPTHTRVKPSFNCQKARTPTEKLICRDDDLALLELSMVSAYNKAMGQRSLEQRKALRRDHVEWFKEYARTCDAAGSESERKACVTRYLTDHTRELTALSN